MSITDELREFIDGADGYELWCPRHKKELTAIADRIDAEHERAMAAAALLAGVPMTDEHMAEHGWVRLPKDADGVPINIGDVMVYADGNTCPTKVVALIPPSVFLTDDGPRYADMCRHKPTTVEDVLTELTDEVWNRCCIGMTGSDSGISELVAEYAAKLQLREVDE